MKKAAIGRAVREYIFAINGATCSGRVGPFAVLVGLLLGSAAAVMGLPFLLIVGGGLIGVTLLLTIIQKGYKVFWSYLIFLLLGYLFLGKGLAYVGIYPVYVAETGLALAGISELLVLLLNRLKGASRCLRLEIALLLVFMIWQAFRTIPYLAVYSLDAGRDAILWGYAAYALFICLLIPREAVSRFFLFYGRVLPYYLMWLLVAFVFVKISPLHIRFPGAPAPLIWLKSGDVGVHLGGAGAFMLLRLDLRSGRWSKAMLWFLWLLWGTAWVAYGVSNRAGMLSALAGIGVVVLWKPKVKWDRPLILAVLVLALLFMTNFNLKLSVGKQDVSFQQIVDNVQSIVGQGKGTLEGTKQWRLSWWKTILDYTFGGEYFWVGKGYGINLADDDGFQVKRDHSLRSPHNVFVTILARSGVPGLVLWFLFLLSFGWMLMKTSLARKRRADPWDTRYALWLLAYWLAFLVNASFDVFLEGPMGGIWFWSLVGMSLTYFARQNRVPQAAATEQNPEPLLSRGAA